MLGMNQQSTTQQSPPYVVFETRAIEKRKPDTEGGGVSYVDTDFACITSHGSKDTVEKVVGDWFTNLRNEVRNGRFPQPWLDGYKAEYAAWRSNQEVPITGTAIKNWPVATPAEIKRLNLLGIRAVEDLATANEELIGRLGMGGRSLCQRAKDWVTAKEGTAPLVLQVDSLRQSLKGLENRLEASEKKNAVLEAQLGQSRSMAATSAAAGLPMDIGSLDDRLAEARDAAEAGAMSDDDAITDALKE